MTNKELTKNYRSVMGEKLKEFRSERGISTYAIRKKSGLSHAQIADIESGSSSYTIDSFLLYVMACELYLYFAEKENTGHDELIQKAISEHPDNARDERLSNILLTLNNNHAYSVEDALKDIKKMFA